MFCIVYPLFMHNKTLLYMYTGKDPELILDEERESLEFIFIFPSIWAIWIKSVGLIRYRKSNRVSEQTAILTSLVISFGGFFLFS